MLTLNSPVSELSGVGTARAAQLKKLGIETLKDLLYCLPRSFENRSDVRLLRDFNPDFPVSYILTVASEVKSARIRKNLTIEKFRAFDESGSCEIVFFNSPFIKDVFHIGSSFRFFGKISAVKSKLQLSAPKYEPYVPGIALRDYIPVYHLTEGLSGKVLEKLVLTALRAVGDTIVDPLPEKIRLENSLPTLSYAIKNIHNPESDIALKKSIERLAFNEMLYFGIGVSLSLQYKTAVPGVKFSPTGLEEFTEALPYTLTDSQKNAINDIYSDTVIVPRKKENGHMARIIVGDVGCGKTVCAAAALYIAAKSGYQSALMAPTEILARQHYSELSGLFLKFGFKTELLLGSTSQKEKKRIY
ncbi:MAG: DEAD/DEAH box helicase [Clostridia bacterium]|nr:DEAD/DEAH box helicase [Clostridia bacterium]